MIKAFTDDDLKRLKDQVANGVYVFDESIVALIARLKALQEAVDAADYCLRHGYIDKGAVLFTELKKKIEASRKAAGRDR